MLRSTPPRDSPVRTHQYDVQWCRITFSAPFITHIEHRMIDPAKPKKTSPEGRLPK